MWMLFIHVILWCLAMASAIYCAVIAFKRKWYFTGSLDAAIALVDATMLIHTIVNYFAH